MGWQAAVVGALGAAQYKQQGAIGKYNQAVANRNAQSMEQQAEAIDQKTEFDILQFDKEFKKVEGEQRVASAKAGVSFTGTALRIQRQNAEEAQLQKELIRYNSQVAKSQAIERANAFRIQGEMAKMTSRAAQIQTITQTGTSLLGMSGGGFGDSSGYGATGSNRMIVGSTGIMGGGV